MAVERGRDVRVQVRLCGQEGGQVYFLLLLRIKQT